MICPRCGPTGDWTAIRRIYVDGHWRTYRKHRACGTAVAIAQKAVLVR